MPFGETLPSKYRKYAYNHVGDQLIYNGCVTVSYTHLDVYKRQAAAPETGVVAAVLDGDTVDARRDDRA